ncbi:glycosyltransferase family 2 protein [Cognataquiflexum rubidum]|uniref:glycosyltransferase family 2 protein n=1 Tax=Cognataquiflexum rubidum TaxID=2922273 RepID=UPI001F12D585|nr:glycosyltransferase family 2 protein [Cognataquiflexum rubidum]MCH6234042.1 glycosyltransferase family 2 protein [Cognataquiflexum rubidum]
MISVVILTKNEEKDLPQCLNSLSWSDDIHILDSGSTDKTLRIAADYNTKVIINKFESFGKQRNFALENIFTKYDWILFLDADEVVTPAFEKALRKSISEADDQVAGYYCCWKMILDGKWLKRCDNFPKWQFRLMRKGRANFKDFGHGQKEGTVLGNIEFIKEPYLHYGFSKGWSQWIERHNKYSSQEAISRLNNCPSFKHIFSSQGSVRNPALKSWLSKVPGWPLLRFIQAYFFNLGFTEGIPGLIYCINMGYYEFLIQIKMRELKRNSPIPKYGWEEVKSI